MGRKKNDYRRDRINMTLKNLGRERKSKQHVVCEECGKRIFLTDENTEKIAGITVVFCECGNEFELK